MPKYYMTGQDCKQETFSCCFHPESDHSHYSAGRPPSHSKRVVRCCWCASTVTLIGKWLPSKDHGKYAAIGEVVWESPYKMIDEGANCKPK